MSAYIIVSCDVVDAAIFEPYVPGVMRLDSTANETVVLAERFAPRSE